MGLLLVDDAYLAAAGARANAEEGRFLAMRGPRIIGDGLKGAGFGRKRSSIVVTVAVAVTQCLLDWLERKREASFLPRPRWQTTSRPFTRFLPSLNSDRVRERQQAASPLSPTVQRTTTTTSMAAASRTLSPTQDGIAQAHDANERKIHDLETRVERTTSPPLSSSPSQPDSRPHSKSPTSLASALFRRDKGGSKSSSKKSSSSSKKQAPVASRASQADLKALENEVRQTRDDEMKLVSAAIGTSADGAALNEDGQDDVLDLADQLLAQLDAREQEQQPAPMSSQPGIVAPQPIPPPADPSLAVPAAVSSSGQSTGSGSKPSRTPSGLSSSSTSSQRKPSFGARLKEAFSPPSSSSASSAANVEPSAASPSASAGGPHKNRHALRKERKKAEDDRLRAEAQAEVDASRANGQVDPALHEKQAMDRLLRQWQLEIHEMEPDGHCMYSAVADQLNAKRILKKADYKVTRKAAAEYMRDHMDDFLPYLPAEDEDGAGEGLLTPEGYKHHCDNVEDSSVWGSHTEVRADIQGNSPAFLLTCCLQMADSCTVKVFQGANLRNSSRFPGCQSRGGGVVCKEGSFDDILSSAGLWPR